MSVSADKYSRDTFNDKDTVSGQTTTKNVYAYIPLALTEYTKAADDGKSYAQMTDAEKKDDNGFCEKFFCDAVWKKQDSEGKDCVLGLIDVDHPLVGGVWNRNLDLHTRSDGGARSRESKLGVNINGTNYIVLSDGGLNTKPYIEIGEIELCACTYIVFRVNFRNAYYINTDNFQLKVELFQNQGNNTYHTTADHTIVLDIVQSDLLMTKKTSGTDIYIGIDLLPTAITEAVIGDKFRLTMYAYNEETLAPNVNGNNPFVSNKGGSLNAPTYGREKVVDSNIRPFVVKKITNLSDDPDDGVPYTILLEDSFYALKSVPLGQGLLENGDTGYPNLMNLFFTSYLLEDSPEATPTYTARGEGLGSATSVHINGVQGRAFTGDIVNSFLPDGYYYGFPKDLRERYPDGTTPDNAKQIYILEVNGNGSQNGNVVNWWNSHQVTPPTPTPRSPFTDFEAIIRPRSGDSEASWAEELNGVYDVYIYPKIKAVIGGTNASTKGNVYISVFRVDGNSGDVYEIASFNVEVSFTPNALGQEKYLDVDTDPDNYVETGWPEQTNLAIVHDRIVGGMNVIEYYVQVTSSDPLISGANYDDFVSTYVSLDTLVNK